MTSGFFSKTNNNPIHFSFCLHVDGEAYYYKEVSTLRRTKALWYYFGEALVEKITRIDSF